MIFTQLPPPGTPRPATTAHKSSTTKQVPIILKSHQCLYKYWWVGLRIREHPGEVNQESVEIDIGSITEWRFYECEVRFAVTGF